MSVQNCIDTHTSTSTYTSCGITLHYFTLHYFKLHYIEIYCTTYTHTYVYIYSIYKAQCLVVPPSPRDGDSPYVYM